MADGCCITVLTPCSSFSNCSRFSVRSVRPLLSGESLLRMLDASRSAAPNKSCFRGFTASANHFRQLSRRVYLVRHLRLQSCSELWHCVGRATVPSLWQTVSLRNVLTQTLVTDLSIDFLCRFVAGPTDLSRRGSLLCMPIVTVLTFSRYTNLTQTNYYFRNETETGGLCLGSTGLCFIPKVVICLCEVCVARKSQYSDNRHTQKAASSGQNCWSCHKATQKVNREVCDQSLCEHVSR
jgi:hypothetical protein